jgi:hypothetical protein
MLAQICAIIDANITFDRFNFDSNAQIGANIEVNQKKGLIINPLFNVLIDKFFTNHSFLLSKK